MLPDLPLFFPHMPSYLTTHSFLLGVPTCLPYGIVAFILFRLVESPCLPSPREIRANACGDTPLSVSC
jgi:hypothetical protein